MKAFLIGDVHLGRKFRNKDIPIEKRGIREQILRLRFQQYIDLAIKTVNSGKCQFVVQGKVPVCSSTGRPFRFLCRSV